VHLLGQNLNFTRHRPAKMQAFNRLEQPGGYRGGKIDDGTAHLGGGVRTGLRRPSNQVLNNDAYLHIQV